MNFFDEKSRKSSENFVQKVEISSQVNSAWQGVLSAGKLGSSSCILSGKATEQHLNFHYLNCCNKVSFLQYSHHYRLLLDLQYQSK
jgi:hypothetical protein